MTFTRPPAFRRARNAFDCRAASSSSSLPRRKSDLGLGIPDFELQFSPMKLLRRRPPRWYHSLSDNVRETLVLLRQFRGVLLLFSLTVIGGGWLYFILAQSTAETHPASLPEAVFLVLSMTFLQAN